MKRRNATLGTSDTSGTGGTERGNTKLRSVRSRNYVFTLNNYERTDCDTLTLVFQTEQASYLFQEEIGESGTKHLQGIACFINPRSFNEVKLLIPKAHWEVCKNKLKAIQYCCKEDTRSGEIYTNMSKLPDTLRDPMSGKIVRAWQKEILEMIKSEPDDRKIHWYYDKIGGTGKTILSKSILINNKKACYVYGKGNDIAHYISKQKEHPNIIIFDFPRSTDGYVSYGAIEQCKNGLIFSGKYDSEMLIFNPPHIIVFSNFPPAPDKLSADRIIVTDINSYNILHDLNK